MTQRILRFRDLAIGKCQCPRRTLINLSGRKQTIGGFLHALPCGNFVPAHHHEGCANCGHGLACDVAKMMLFDRTNGRPIAL